MEMSRKVVIIGAGGTAVGTGVAVAIGGGVYLQPKPRAVRGGVPGWNGARLEE